MSEAIAHELNCAVPAGANAGVRRLSLTCFRSYERLDMDLDGRPVVLTGPNGAGKTNILEALSYLTPGRGLRGAELKGLIWNAGGAAVTECANGRPWAVSALIETGEAHVQVGAGLEIQASGAAKRVVRVDGAPAAGPVALGRYLRAVWLTPAMDRLFMEGASARRRFFDRLALSFDSGHAARVGAYEKALRERQRVLKEPRWDAAWLDALEIAMAESGVAVAAARNETLTRLSAALDRRGFSIFPLPALALDGGLESALNATPAAQVEDAFRAELSATRRRDAEAGRCLTGAHRTDLVVRHGQKNAAARVCSTGEQKALLISIVLAHAQTMTAVNDRRTPVLLLDEIAAHLDEIRRAALYDEICASGCQAWMTGTDRALFRPLEGRAQFFTVSGGCVRPDEG